MLSGALLLESSAALPRRASLDPKWRVSVEFFSRNLPAGYYDLNTKPWILFLDDNVASTRRGEMKELQCSGCEKSGYPESVLCENKGW